MFSSRRSREKKKARLRKNDSPGLRSWWEEKFGGRARLKVILLLGGVFGLDAADKAAVAAVAASLKEAFHIGNTEVGLIISTVLFTGAVATLPMGVLVDRTRRTPLLYASVALWAGAMILSASATSYTFFLIVRLLLGIVTATAIPAVASLTGDFFPARDRAGIYGLILAGEYAGTGVGFVIADEISVLINWRAAFIALAIPSGLLAWALYRYLPEPARGGQSRIQPGQDEVPSAEKPAEQGGRQLLRQEDPPSSGGEETETARKIVREAHVAPDDRLVLKEDPGRKSLWWVTRYVLRIRTNLLLIIASGLGYFFFSGVRGFGIIYLTSHFAISQAWAVPFLMGPAAGAFLGVIYGGDYADRLLKRGWLTARVWIPALGLFAAVVFFAPAIWTTRIPLAIVLLTGAAASLGSANPSLDAARLDIMHYKLWGRSESIRTTFRKVLEGAAPTLFGLLSDRVFGGGPDGLMYTFLLMLIPLLIAGTLAVPAARSYPRDVATADASFQKTSGKNRPRERQT